MAAPALRIQGTPFVAGTARGRLQAGAGDNADGRIVLLEQAPTLPFKSPPAGFVLVDGAAFSHSLVPLLGSGVPGLLVSRTQAAALAPGMEVQLDGNRGLLTSDLSTSLPAPHTPPGDGTPRTRDGVTVTLNASARDLPAVQQAVAGGAAAIGLLRSEFLAPDAGAAPGSAFYRQVFAQLCAAADGLTLTIRLFDLAASKHPAWLRLPAAETGVLGRQGVRLYDCGPVSDIYRAQLEAIEALPADYAVRILLPYVADRQELSYWYDDIRQRLARPVEIGAMAETPAAALALDSWRGTAEFAALGCNDLMQCLFGADRDQPSLRRYLDPYAPALYRFLRQVAATAGDATATLQLCGMLPQLPGILPLLLGCGFRVFSVEPAQLAYLRGVVLRTDTGAAAGLLEQACAARTSADVRRLLAEYNAATGDP